MITIKSQQDLSDFAILSYHRSLLITQFQNILKIYQNKNGNIYNPDLHGYLIYFNDYSDENSLQSLGLQVPFVELSFEGADYHLPYQCHELHLVMNNNCILTFIVPDQFVAPTTSSKLKDLYGDCNEF